MTASSQIITRGLIIRSACQADVSAIRAMQERSMWVLGGNFYQAPQIAAFLREFGTMDDAIVAEGHFFVAEGECGTIVGSGGWTRCKPSYADGLEDGCDNVCETTVRSVFVDPATARRGIASMIMRHIEWDAGEHGIESLCLTATLSGVALYTHLGYRVEASTAVCLAKETRFACVRMVKHFR